VEAGLLTRGELLPWVPYGSPRSADALPGGSDAGGGARQRGGEGGQHGGVGG